MSDYFYFPTSASYFRPTVWAWHGDTTSDGRGRWELYRKLNIAPVGAWGVGNFRAAVVTHGRLRLSKSWPPRGYKRKRNLGSFYG